MLFSSPKGLLIVKIFSPVTIPLESPNFTVGSSLASILRTAISLSSLKLSTCSTENSRPSPNFTLKKEAPLITW